MHEALTGLVRVEIKTKLVKLNVFISYERRDCETPALFVFYHFNLPYLSLYHNCHELTMFCHIT